MRLLQQNFVEKISTDCIETSLICFGQILKEFISETTNIQMRFFSKPQWNKPLSY